MISPPSRPVDFKLTCVRHLESTPRHSLVEATQALGACTMCFHAQKSVTISNTLQCRHRRSTHRLLYQPTCVDPSDCLGQLPYVSDLSRTFLTATICNSSQPSSSIWLDT